MNLITFLINLDGSDDRLNSARAQLDQQGIAFTRVSAFDGRGLNLTEVRDYDEAHAVRYMGRKLKGGEGAPGAVAKIVEGPKTTVTLVCSR